MSFGGGIGSGGSLFGNLNKSDTSNTTQPSSLFGNTATSSARTTSAPALFGNTTTNTTNLFTSPSGSAPPANPFGGSAQPTTGTPFGASTGTKENNNDDSAITGGKNIFGNIGTPNKQSDASAQSHGTNPFPQNGTSTPANKLFGANNSTTPAGPPPANPSGGLFGGLAASKPGGLFTATASATTGPTTANQTSTSSTLFSSAAQNNSSNLFGTAASQPSGGSLFQTNNNQGNDQSNANTTSTEALKQAQTTSSISSSTSKPPFSFPSSASQPASSSTNTAPAASSSVNIFGNLGATKDANSNSQLPPNPFSSISQQPGTSAAQPSATNTFQPTSSTPNSLNIATNAQSNDTSKANTSTAAATSAPSLFGATTSASSSTPQGFSATTQTTSQEGQSATTSGAHGLSGSIATSGLSASTTGQPPNAQSRLKNKSMDDIITRWASDLTKYQKEFQNQAEKIAGWDRQLVENSNAITKLYSKTYQAERDTAEIQKQLTAVESHQDELAQWLDRYEQEVDDLMSRQVSQKDGLQGPDQERERTYKTAENVSERLGEMGQDLTSMIEEINTASSNISKSNRVDDPLSQIVKVLNGHLSQLQFIDQGTAEIQTKIAAAQREAQRVGARGRNGFAFDAAEEFSRSTREQG